MMLIRRQPCIIAIYTDEVTSPFMAIPDRFPQVDVHFATTASEFTEVASDADVVFMARKYERDLVLNAPKLKWLHVGGTGVDRLRPFNDLDPRIVITHTPGLNAGMMADYVACVVSMLTWNFARIIRNQSVRRWERWPVARLQGKTLALVGLGSIGRAVALKTGCMGLRVTGAKRQPEAVSGVERVVGPDQLHEILSEADFVVVAVPLTSATSGMIGMPQFNVMKETAYLINIARGAVVEEEPLILALQQGHIAGAALDVFEEEPLPPSSPLWDLDNVILSPHISSWSTDYQERAVTLFCTELARYITGQRLTHVIDRSQEY